MLRNQKVNSEAYGKLILDLVNSKSEKEALKGLIENISKIFGFSKQFVKNEKAKVNRHPQKSIILLPHYTIAIDNLRDCLDEFIETRNLANNRMFHFYLNDYNRETVPRVLQVQQDGSLVEKNVFAEDSFEDAIYDIAVSYCLVRFFLNRRNWILLKKCQNCNKFSIGYRPRREGTRSFCSKECKDVFYREKRKKEKYHTEYMKEYRKL